MATRHPAVDATHRTHGTPRPVDRRPWRLPLLQFALGTAWLLAARVLAGGDAPVPAAVWGVLVTGLVVNTAVLAAWLRRRTPAHATPARPAATRDQDLRDLMHALPDGLLLLDGGRVIHANPAGETLLGRAAGGLVERPAADLVDADERDRFTAWLDAPGAPPASLRMRRADGATFRATLTAARVRHEGRRGTLLVVRDLTGAERMRDELAAGNRELHALAARVFTVQEDERRRISRDLHDDIGQSVTAMKLAAGSALGEADPDRRRDDLEDVLVLADATLERLRDLSILLRPPQLDALGLEAALRWHADRLLRHAGIALSLDIDALPARPHPAVEQACFRIAQEALTNVMRHAGATGVEVRLHAGDGGLHLQVRDDGAGFAPADARGLGLVIMRERAHGTGGRLEVATTPGSGTRIEACWPSPQAAPAPPGGDDDR